MTTTRSASEIWLIGNPNLILALAAYRPMMMLFKHYFFHIFKNQNDTTNDAVKRTIEAVTEIWLKSEISMKSSWMHSKQLLKNFESWKKYKKSKKRDNKTESNYKKRFYKSLETLFDLAAKNAEKQIVGDRLRTEKAKKEDVAFLHDQGNARKM